MCVHTVSFSLPAQLRCHSRVKGGGRRWGVLTGNAARTGVRLDASQSSLKRNPDGEASQKWGWEEEQAWFPPEVRVIGTVGRGQQLTASWGLGPPGPK